jgi:hypothetical protein
LLEVALSECEGTLRSGLIGLDNSIGSGTPAHEITFWRSQVHSKRCWQFTMGICTRGLCLAEGPRTRRV